MDARCAVAALAVVVNGLNVPEEDLVVLRSEVRPGAPRVVAAFGHVHHAGSEASGNTHEFDSRSFTSLSFGAAQHLYGIGAPVVVNESESHLLCFANQRSDLIRVPF